MASYLERYKQGETVQVWQELVALGEQVRTEPIYTDARAVAQETMRRARQNIELLFVRLRQLGFKFQDPAGIFMPTTKTQLDELEKFEKQVGPVPLSVRAWIEQVGTVNFMGNYPHLSYYGAKNKLFTGKFQIGIGGNQTTVKDFDSMLKDIQSMDKGSSPVDFSGMMGMIDNLAKLQGLFGQTSDTDSADDAPPNEAESILADPLVVDFKDLTMDDYMGYKEWIDESGEPDSFCVIISPDISEKSNIMGDTGYEIDLPNAAADALLRYTEWREMTFVEYLRLSFDWAGFPGLQDYDKRDDKFLTSLKQGLLPL